MQTQRAAFKWCLKKQLSNSALAWYMRQWLSVRSRWLDIGRVPFFVLHIYGPRQSRDPRKWKKKKIRWIYSHLDRSSFVSIGFITLQKNFVFLRIKNDLFNSRAGKKKPIVFVAQETPNPKQVIWAHFTLFLNYLFVFSSFNIVEYFVRIRGG